MFVGSFGVKIILISMIWKVIVRAMERGPDRVCCVDNLVVVDYSYAPVAL